MQVSYGALALMAMHLACIACILGALRLADFELSACAVTSSLLQMLSLSFRAVQLLFGGGAVSKRTLTLELMSIGCRLSSTLVKNGYLPVDATGDFLYQFVDICSFVMALLLRRWASRRQRHCLHAGADSKMSIMPVMLLAILFASICHGSENASPIFDTLWLTGLFSGLCASIPQRLVVVYMGEPVPAFLQHYFIVTYASWIIHGWLMFTVFVYYVDAADISRFTCAIFIVHACAAWLFIEYVGTSITNSTGLYVVCSKQLAVLDEALQSKRPPLLGGLRIGCIIISAMLLVCTLSAQRALVSVGATHFVSTQLRLSLVFLSVAFFTKNSRKQSRGSRNSIWHIFAQFALRSKTSETHLDRGKCIASKKRQATESGKSRKATLEIGSVIGSEVSSQPPRTSILQMPRLKASLDLSAISALSASSRGELKTHIACRLSSVYVGLNGAKARMHDRWVQGAIIGIMLVLVSIFFNEQNTLILYGAGFFCTAIVNSASIRLQWHIAPSVLRKRTSLGEASNGCNSKVDEARVQTHPPSASPCLVAPFSDGILLTSDVVSADDSSLGMTLILCEAAGARQASEESVDLGTCDGNDAMSNVALTAQPGCEPAIGHVGDASILKESQWELESSISSLTKEARRECEAAVHASASEQTCDDSKSFEDELANEALIESEPNIRQSIRISASKHSWGELDSSDDEFANQRRLGCELTIRQPGNGSTSMQPLVDFANSNDELTKETSWRSTADVTRSKQFWGDLESSDDEFAIRARGLVQHEAGRNHAENDDLDTYSAQGDAHPLRQWAAKIGDDDHWRDHWCCSKLAPARNARWVGKPNASNQQTRTIDNAQADPRRRRRNQKKSITHHDNWRFAFVPQKKRCSGLAFGC